ncbi:hypothetical protein ABT56_06290 [Photobacterium aquae]|uniref:Uncharacterized protein n=1 Tax=Photobacterium aquae TaxID=1195763 RepID=A0A0J1H5T5_9GAMM|nr:hypothetical protein [Photobacterium aquae]KLV07154.1 hypothetical protein ABT56_06290 [Photobacterium aquae]
MGKFNRFGLLLALVGLIGFIALLAGGTQFPVVRWPIEALSGLAFSFAWGLGVPVWLAYTMALVCFAAVAMACYWIGKKLSIMFRR